MASSRTDKLTPTFQQIAVVIGLMIAVFGLLQVLLPTSLVQPIGTIAAVFILTSALVLAGRWTWNTAGLTWAGTSILLIIAHLILSQPATLTGFTVRDDGSPLPGLTLILTNSAGVDQKTVTDKDGRFEVRGVPEGRYTITLNGKLIYSGDIPTGWQRIFSPVVNIGTYPVQIASISSPTPSATVATAATVLAATLSASDTPASVPTTKAIATVTNTLVPSLTQTVTMTATTILTNTPIPLLAALGDQVQVTFRDDFTGSGLSSKWFAWNKLPEVKDGYLVFEGRGGDDDGIVRYGFIVNKGILLSFQYELAEVSFFFHNSDEGGNVWDSGLYRSWNFERYISLSSPWQINSSYGVRGGEGRMYQNITLSDKTWYFLLLYLGDNGVLHARLWERDNPTKFLINLDQLPPIDDYKRTRFSFGMKVKSGILRVDSYEELQFPPQYIIPTLPPQGAR